jgi:hypothetical protein
MGRSSGTSHKDKNRSIIWDVRWMNINSIERIKENKSNDVGKRKARKNKTGD